MPEETRPSRESSGEIPAPPSESPSEEQQVQIILERARQDVKRIARQEREGEKIAVRS